MTMDIAQRTLNNALDDLSILAGKTIGPNDIMWNNVVDTAVSNLRALALILEDKRNGGAFISFPSVEEAVAALK